MPDERRRPPNDGTRIGIIRAIVLEYRVRGKSKRNSYGKCCIKGKSKLSDRKEV